MNLNDIGKRMSELKEWGLEGNAIMKEFEFPDFKEAMIFVNNVALLAEKAVHHPVIIIDYNKVRITLTTHSEKAITEKDFELAKEIDRLRDAS